ncbi:MAG: aquaporin [Terricaulis sp.]
MSFGAWVAKRMNLNEMLGYWVAQCLGAVVGAGVLYLIASGAPTFDIERDGLGQNGFGLGHSPGDYELMACFVFEAVATFLFLVTILGVTTPGSTITPFAGLGIGLALVVIHIVGIQVTGVSVNPARSLGPAVWVTGSALAQLWLFIVAPLLGAGLAGLAFRAKLLSTED